MREGYIARRRASVHMGVGSPLTRVLSRPWYTYSRMKIIQGGDLMYIMTENGLRWISASFIEGVVRDLYAIVHGSKRAKR